MMFSSKLSMLVLAGLSFTTACDSSGSEPESRDRDDDEYVQIVTYEARARSAEVVTGWCEASDCGAQAANGTCWCDQACDSLGDCCDNKALVCDGGGVGDICGGFFGIACNEGLVCIQDAGTCDIADIGGTCQVPPAGCSREWDPVCGCNGETYANECEANRAGAPIDHAGACTADYQQEGEICGVWSGFCDEGLVCIKTTGDCWPDADGVCTAVPDTCTEDYDPVCGCDGVTYVNACHATQAGVTVESQGECGGGEGDACGPWTGTCDAGLNCIKPPGMCWYPDGDGTCTAPPAVCSQDYQPVCGCDGVTYDNLCKATQAGASIERLGAC